MADLSPGVQRIAQILMAQQAAPPLAPSPIPMIEPQGRYINGGQWLPNGFDPIEQPPFTLPPDKNTYDADGVMIDSFLRSRFGQEHT